MTTTRSELRVAVVVVRRQTIFNTNTSEYHPIRQFSVISANEGVEIRRVSARDENGVRVVFRNSKNKLGVARVDIPLFIVSVSN